MDNQTYDQIFLNSENIGENINYLKDNMPVTLLYWQNQLIRLEIPIKVDLKVIETEPGTRGDTAQGTVTKPAKLETGYTLQVPIFVKEDDTIRINTETGEYAERVS